MKKNHLLLEIGCEDLPDWAGKHFISRFEPFFLEGLKQNKLEAREIMFFFTPRRFIILAKDIPVHTQKGEKEIIGPRYEVAFTSSGMPGPAANGFAKAQGIKVSSLKTKQINGKKFVYTSKVIPSINSIKILSKIIPFSLQKTDIPRGMRWNQSNEIFYRPVRWILALFGNNVVPVEFGGIKASHYTFGHRFLYPKKISVRNWKDYFDRIEKAFVIPDEQIRQTFIIKLINKSLKENEIFNKTVAENLANLVEYPCVIRCHFPDLQYNLPQDVLKIIIEKARCIPIFCQGRIQPEFFVVSDGNSGADISKNYENLLRTRILDAQFFYDSDLSLPFYQFKEKLEKIIFHPRWGSIADRVDRLVKIASIVSDIFNLTDEEKNIFIRAAELSKYDIASEMVKEFPDLQGTMGAIYADISGESRQVCTAIAQHILPRFYNDSMPEDRCAILLGIIDRIDYLCCFVSIDTDVSGSQDPYGLRRISTTLFQLIYKSAIDYDYAKIIDKIFVVYGFSPSELEMAKNKIKNFLLQRFEAHLEAESVPKGLRTAVLTIEKMRFLRARYKLDAFKDFIRETSNVDTILIPVTRVANILKQAKEKNIHIDAFKKELLQQDEEIKLASIAEIYLARLNELLGKNNFKEFLCLLAELKQPIDAFFDKILVMCPEEDLRNNRLALLKMFNDVFLRFADFSFIREEDIKNAIEN